MYISNENAIKTSKYECGKLIGKYLIKKNIPLLSQSNNKMIFKKTNKLQNTINNMPFYLKVLLKVGVING